MATIYYEKDADPAALEGQRIAVVGYGNQGRSWALNLRVLIVAVAAALLFAGVNATRNAPLDVFPEFAPPLVEVQTEAPGLSTEEVDALVTVPLENSLNGLPFLKTIRSKSVLGLFRPVDRILDVLAADERDKRHHLFNGNEGVGQLRFAKEQLHLVRDALAGRFGEHGRILPEEVLGRGVVLVLPFADLHNRGFR